MQKNDQRLSANITIEKKTVPQEVLHMANAAVVNIFFTFLYHMYSVQCHEKHMSALYQIKSAFTLSEAFG